MIRLPMHVVEVEHVVVLLLGRQRRGLVVRRRNGRAGSQ